MVPLLDHPAATQRPAPGRLVLTAVVPATGPAPTLERCRRALVEARDGPDELIVVSEPGLGVAAARNLGGSRARGEVIVFVDADVLVHVDAFTRIRAALADDAGLSAVFGAYDDRPPAPGAVSGFRNLLHHHVHLHGAGPAGTFWTGLGAVTREAFEALGGFDGASLRWPRSTSRAGDFMADVEFGMRLVDSGRRVSLDPSIQGTHLKAWSLREMVAADFFLRGVPWTRLVLRRRSLPSELNLGWRHRLSAVLSLVVALATLARRPRPAAGAGGLLVLVNHSFYRLLLRRRGPRAAAAGVVVHVLHHMTSLASALTGVCAHVSEQRSGHAGCRAGARP